MLFVTWHFILLKEVYPRVLSKRDRLIGLALVASSGFVSQAGSILVRLSALWAKKPWGSLGPSTWRVQVWTTWCDVTTTALAHFGSSFIFQKINDLRLDSTSFFPRNIILGKLTQVVYQHILIITFWFVSIRPPCALDPWPMRPMRRAWWLAFWGASLTLVPGWEKLGPERPKKLTPVGALKCFEAGG